MEYIAQNADIYRAGPVSYTHLGVRVVRAFGREKYEVEKFDKVNDNFRNLAAHQANLLAYYWSISDLLTMMPVSYTHLLDVRGIQLQEP